ncbi:hypothetical protein D3C73_1375070 [compost metagenome]
MLQHDVVIHDFIVRNCIGCGLIIENEGITLDIGFRAFSLATKGSQTTIRYFTTMFTDGLGNDR